MNGQPLAEAAMRYGELGFYVVPLWPGSKEPLRGLGYDRPSQDLQVIKHWWMKCPDANIGLPTGGHFNSLIILDLDITSEADGTKTLSQLLEEYHIILPDTAISRTGSGGRHLYFRSSGLARIESRKNAFPGIDILSEGAHVVAPPSVHENGKKYQWIHGGPTLIQPGSDDLYRLILTRITHARENRT